MQTPESFQLRSLVAAPVERLWQILIDPVLMLQWMGDPELELEVITTWKPGESILTRGFHHVKFENKGTVLKFEPPHRLTYNHLSSVSRLPDRPENYSTIEFRMEPVQDQTLLTITVSGFPTESIYKHLEFYWRNTVGVMKQVAERK